MSTKSKFSPELIEKWRETYTKLAAICKNRPPEDYDADDKKSERAEEEANILDETEWHDMIFGWGLAQGLSVSDATDFGFKMSDMGLL